MKFTKRPLEIIGPSEGRCSERTCDTEHATHTLGNAGGDYAIRDHEGYIIGEAYCEVYDGVFVDARANAQLWVAAPVLYEACKAFIEAWDKCHQLETTDVALRLAREAVALVDGKE